jgi:putative membrane protein
MNSWVLWVKALHVISVIAWMAGLLYLPRLFVYHAETPTGSPQSETFKLMERRLLKAIMTPAMIAVWITGPATAYGFSEFSEHWLHAKLALVLIMSGFHGYLAKLTKAFAMGQNRHGARFFRFLNEIPTLLMVVIVILVVVKPF